MFEAVLFLTSCIVINLVHIMGADQSRPSNVDVDEKLRERLQAFRMNEDRAVSEKDGVVHVGDARTWVSARRPYATSNVCPQLLDIHL